MKLCINCKHILASEALPDDPEFSRCGFERPISPVTGRFRQLRELPYCSVARARTGTCTPDGINWSRADHVMTPEEEEELMKGMPHV